MSEPIAAVETPTAAPAPVDAPAEMSVADHAAQFGPQADTPPAETEDEPQPHHSAEQRREPPTGKFIEGKKRSRSKDAVERIGQLTGRAKTAEERLAATEAELATLRAQIQTRPPAAAPAPPATPRPVAEPPRVTDPNDPEPQEADPKFGGDPLKFIQAHNRWSARDEYRQVRAQEQRQAQQHRVLATFADQVDRAKAEIPDFEAIALAGPSRIPEGSLVDQFVMTDDNGAKVLYHLHRPENAAELDALLRLPVLPAMKHLALLSQRYASPQSASAGPTTSAAPPVRFLPPKPPNVVRTEAQRAGNEPAPTDGTLSIAEHRKYFAPRR